MDNWLRTGSLPKKIKLTVEAEDAENIRQPALEDDEGHSHQFDESKSQSTPNEKQAVKHHKSVRQYDESYIKYGFTCIGEGSEQKPQCVICYEVLSNECMKPSKLKRHQETKHQSLLEKPQEYFRRKQKELLSGQKTIKKAANVSSKALEASYIVSHLIAKAGKPHTIGEKLILPAAKQLVSIMCGEKIASELDVVPLSNDTVSLRISDMASDIQTTLVNRIKSSLCYAIQLDESTDVASNANVLVFVRYIWNEHAMEEFLFCRPLQTNTTAEQVFNLLSSFFVENGIDWQKCVGICTDGARSMTGRHSGLVTRIKNIAPNAIWVHCSIHREALATKSIPQGLKEVMDIAVKTVNFIKSRPLNSRLFSVLCNEMGSSHTNLLLHTEVRWLSRGKVLTRLFELRGEVLAFLRDHPFQHCASFEDNLWLSQLAYLADIFARLNELNCSLQGDVTVFDVRDKINAMVKKFDWLVKCVEKQDFTPFPCLSSLLQETEFTMDNEVSENMKKHMVDMRQQLTKYFPENDHNEQNDWIHDPFKNDIALHLPNVDQEKLLELSCDSTLKSEFKSRLLIEFWLCALKEYPNLATRAITVLIPFATTYLCERGFSTLTNMKTKYRNKLHVEADLRLALSKISPNFQHLCARKQAQVSH
jgi:zinc finger BED domain-containing protein 5/7/8/9